MPEVTNEMLDELVANATMLRAEFMRKFGDARRNINAECGYPETSAITPQHLQDLHDRDPIAARVNQLMARECWEVTPNVYEDEDGETATEFEQAWDALGRGLRGEKSKFRDEEGSAIYEYLKRADELSGIGSFGVVLLGFDDGLPLSQPVAMRSKTESGATLNSLVANEKPSKVPNGAPVVNVFEGSVQGTDAQYTGVQFGDDEVPQATGDGAKLIYMRVFPESLVQIMQFETNEASPRFGQPVRYLITLNDPRDPHGGVGLPNASVYVHWTRVLHVADGLQSSEVFGTPRCKTPLNPILDLQKVRGVSSEGYWRAGFPGLSFETHPSLGGDVKLDKPGLKRQFEDYSNGLQRALFLMGMSAKTISGTVSDPTPHSALNIEAICIYLGCPIRVFKGSERGELASSQDDAAWNDRKRTRQNKYITPRIIVPFVDRLIGVGALPEPEEYHVSWPPLDSLSEKDKSDIANTKTAALAAYVGGNVEAIMTPHDYLTRIVGMSDEEARAVMEAVAKNAESKMEDEEAMKAQCAALAPPPPAAEPAAEDAEPAPNAVANWADAVWNAFCATGPGGGRDATCSPKSGASGPPVRTPTGSVDGMRSYIKAGASVIKGDRAAEKREHSTFERVKEKAHELIHEGITHAAIEACDDFMHHVLLNKAIGQPGTMLMLSAAATGIARGYLGARKLLTGNAARAVRDLADFTDAEAVQKFMEFVNKELKEFGGVDVPSLEEVEAAIRAKDPSPKLPTLNGSAMWRPLEV